MEDKLKILGLKDDESKTLFFLLREGPHPAGAIAKHLNIKRPSLYVYLKNLLASGLITQSTKNGIKIFSPITKEAFELIFDQRIIEIKNTKETFFNTIEEIKKNKTWEKPKIQIFEGPEEMRNLARDFLLYRDIETQSYWPIKSMIEVLGVDFFKDFNQERIKRNIWVNAIWPENQKVSNDKYPFMGAGEEFLREIRIAPKEIDFSMGYWIYENKVAFISSKKSNFGFIIENIELADMLRSQFEAIWQISKNDHA